MTLLRAEMEEELGGEPEPGLFALNSMEDFPFLETKILFQKEIVLSEAYDLI